MRVAGDSVDIKLERGDDLSTLEINIELPGARTAHAGDGEGDDAGVRALIAVWCRYGATALRQSFILVPCNRAAQ